MDFVLFPTQSADEFYILAELPSGSSLEHTEEKIQEVEALVGSLPAEELASYITRIGTHGWYNLGENENWALMGVYLTAFAKRASKTLLTLSTVADRRSVGLFSCESLAAMTHSAAPSPMRSLQSLGRSTA